MEKIDILKAQSPAALAEEYIIKSIANKTFPPGSDLPAERDLAEKIGVTRTTLREVLQRLARDGWLSIQHGKPTRVNDVWETAGPHILDTLIQLDSSLAPLIISNMLTLRTKMSEFYITQAVKYHAEKALSLFDNLEQLEDCAEAYTEFDYYIFRQFTFIANMPVYGLIFNGLKNLYIKIGMYYFQNSQGRRLALNFYRELQQLCQTKNYQAVIDCITQHRQQSGQVWLEMLQRLPENFGE